MSKYDDLSREELLRLLEARDRRDATRFGLVWEANEIERDKALNGNFVALDLDPALSCGLGPWWNLIVVGDNFDTLRFLRMADAGRVISGYGDKAGLAGDFAYLRCRRIAEGEMTGIEHAEVWTALQLIHRETLEAYAEAELHWAEDEGGALCYVPRVQAGTAKVILKRSKAHGSVMVYTWQPCLLRPRLAAAGQVQVEPIPQSLARRFGLNPG